MASLQWEKPVIMSGASMVPWIAPFMVVELFLRLPLLSEFHCNKVNSLNSLIASIQALVPLGCYLADSLHTTNGMNEISRQEREKELSLLQVSDQLFPTSLDHIERLVILQQRKQNMYVQVSHPNNNNNKIPPITAEVLPDRNSNQTTL